MTSTIILYPNSGISIRKNFAIDEIEEYLNTIENPLVVTGFQYIKHSLNLEIKLDLSQAFLNYDAQIAYDYVSILNEDQREPVYYFVTDKKWRGQSTLILQLSMDTINTFTYGEAYTLSDKTKINRQHKDRFERIAAKTTREEIYGSGTTTRESGTIYRYTYTYINNAWRGKLPTPLPNWANNITTNNTNVGLASYDFDSDTGTLQLIFQSTGQAYNFSFTGYIDFVAPAHYVRKIDLTSEGVTPILYGTDIEEINPYEEDWYLVYRGSPVVCLLYPRTPINVYAKGNSVITALPATGTYYYFMEDRTRGEAITHLTATTNNGNVYEVSYRPFQGSQLSLNTGKRSCFVIYQSGTNLYIKSLVYRERFGRWSLASQSDFEECTSITLLGESALAHVLTSSQTALTPIYAGSTYEFNIVGEMKSLKSISSVTRTDGDIIKIIKLPYPPLNVNDFSGTWTYNNQYGTLQLSNLDTILSCDIEMTSNPLSELIADISPDIRDDKDIELESKLFHSDYYQPKMVYDSFSFVFALERVNLNYFEMLSNSIFSFTFVATNTVNSRFLFVYPQYTSYAKMLNDYDNILYINRNNEIIVLNDSYLEYLRLGYNYDVKNKQRQEAGQWIGFGLSVVGAVASFASAAITNGVGIGTGIALATSAMAQLTSAVNTTAQAEASNYQKIQQLTNQRNSVAGADDVDLMTYYSNNKAKYMLYKCSEKMRQVLYDLFFYTGYVSGIMAVPDTTSRTRFNFVSCEPVFLTRKNIPEDILTDIELKFNAGITFIHHANGEWDIDQKYENWETNLL